MASKLFKSMRAGDKLYYISPVTLKIKAVTIDTISKPDKGGWIALELVKDITHIHKDLTEERLVAARASEDIDITQLIIVPATLDMVLLNQRTPTIMGTSSELLQSYINQHK